MKKKRASLEDLLAFINQFSIDPNLAWIVPHLYDKKTEYEIIWIHDKEEEFNFHVRIKGDKGSWENMAGLDLAKMLSLNKADLSNFEFQLLRSICTQAVCSFYYIEKAKDLIGKKEIDEAIRLIVEFMNPTPPPTPPTPKLKLVKKKDEA